jgi:hypothetical protein
MGFDIASLSRFDYLPWAQNLAQAARRLPHHIHIQKCLKFSSAQPLTQTAPAAFP